MKVLFALLMLAALPAFAGDDGASRARGVGQRLLSQPGPAATLTSIDGERIELARYYGKQPVYLKFWATWCVPCREQMPAFEKSRPRWRLTMFKAAYRAYLRFLLNRYTRELQVLAAQRANDALAEQVLTHEAEQVRAAAANASPAPYSRTGTPPLSASGSPRCLR